MANIPKCVDLSNWSSLLMVYDMKNWDDNYWVHALAWWGFGAAFMFAVGMLIGIYL